MNNIKCKSAFFFFILFCVAPSEGNSADLVDVRTGDHGSYTRIVLEFDSGVRYSLSGAGDRIFLEISPVKFSSRYNFFRVIANGELLGTLAYVDESEILQLSLFLFDKGLKDGPLLIDEPTRIVIDINQQSPNPDDTSSELADTTVIFSRRDTSHKEAEVLQHKKLSAALAPSVISKPKSIQAPPLDNGESVMMKLRDRIKTLDLFTHITSTIVLVFLGFVGFDLLLLKLINLRKRTGRPHIAGPEFSKEQRLNSNLPSFSDVLSSLNSDADFDTRPVQRTSLGDRAAHRTGQNIPADFDAIDVSIRIPKKMWLGWDGQRLYERLRGRNGIPK